MSEFVELMMTVIVAILGGTLLGLALADVDRTWLAIRGFVMDLGEAFRAMCR